MDQTFLFRVFTGKRYYNGELYPPKYHYVSYNHPDSDFRRMMACRIVEYLFPGANIIRLDHLNTDSLLKVLEYDQRRFR